MLQIRTTSKFKSNSIISNMNLYFLLHKTIFHCSRVMKFTSGSSIGSVLFSFASYQAPNGLILDNAGSVYVGTYSGIFKWVPGSSYTVQVASQMYMGASRIHFDTYGNIYTSGYMNSNIVRYNITSNIC